jgi:hypothetical protein
VNARVGRILVAPNYGECIEKRDKQTPDFPLTTSMLNMVQCKVKLAGNEILNGSTSLDSRVTLGVYGMDNTVCINRLWTAVSTIYI